jgi:rSAM/selenodomain-associated transferase 1
MAKPVIIIFARAPRLGTVKRRLAAGIGAVPALRFHRNQLARITREAAKIRGVDSYLAITPNRARFRPAPRLAILNQGAGDLGARMHQAFARFPRRHVILIGADIPHLAASHLRQAIRALKHHHAAFGPAEDGGYYLIAMAARRPTRPFANVRWSTQHALADTTRNFAHLRTTTLPTLPDIDTEADFQRQNLAHCGAPENPVKLRIGVL